MSYAGRRYLHADAATEAYDDEMRVGPYGSSGLSASSSGAIRVGGRTTAAAASSPPSPSPHSRNDAEGSVSAPAPKGGSAIKNGNSASHANRVVYERRASSLSSGADEELRQMDRDGSGLYAAEAATPAAVVHLPQPRALDLSPPPPLTASPGTAGDAAFSPSAAAVSASSHQQQQQQQTPQQPQHPLGTVNNDGGNSSRSPRNAGEDRPQLYSAGFSLFSDQQRQRLSPRQGQSVASNTSPHSSINGGRSNSPSSLQPEQQQQQQQRPTGSATLISHGYISPIKRAPNTCSTNNNNSNNSLNDSRGSPLRGFYNHLSKNASPAQNRQLAVFHEQQQQQSRAVSPGASLFAELLDGGRPSAGSGDAGGLLAAVRALERERAEAQEELRRYQTLYGALSSHNEELAAHLAGERRRWAAARAGWGRLARRLQREVRDVRREAEQLRQFVTVSAAEFGFIVATMRQRIDRAAAAAAGQEGTSASALQATGGAANELFRPFVPAGEGGGAQGAGREEVARRGGAIPGAHLHYQPDAWYAQLGVYNKFDAGLLQHSADDAAGSGGGGEEAEGEEEEGGDESTTERPAQQRQAAENHALTQGMRPLSPASASASAVAAERRAAGYVYREEEDEETYYPHHGASSATPRSTPADADAPDARREAALMDVVRRGKDAFRRELERSTSSFHSQQQERQQQQEVRSSQRSQLVPSPSSRSVSQHASDGGYLRDREAQLEAAVAELQGELADTHKKLIEAQLEALRQRESGERRVQKLKDLFKSREATYLEEIAILKNICRIPSDGSGNNNNNSARYAANTSLNGGWRGGTSASRLDGNVSGGGGAEDEEEEETFFDAYNFSPLATNIKRNAARHATGRPLSGTPPPSHGAGGGDGGAADQREQEEQPDLPLGGGETAPQAAARRAVIAAPPMEDYEVRGGRRAPTPAPPRGGPGTHLRARRSYHGGGDESYGEGSDNNNNNDDGSDEYDEEEADYRDGGGQRGSASLSVVLDEGGRTALERRVRRRCLEGATQKKQHQQQQQQQRRGLRTTAAAADGSVGGIHPAAIRQRQTPRQPGVKGFVASAAELLQQQQRQQGRDLRSSEDVQTVAQGLWAQQLLASRS